MKKIVYNKLIRDNIPEIIKNAGKECEIVTLNDKDYLDALNKKLQEELKEYLEEGDILEICDIQEIINAIVKAKGYTLSSFDELREKKAIKNGKFEKKLFLKEVTEK